jgi:hypothetical protein
VSFAVWDFYDCIKQPKILVYGDNIENEVLYSIIRQKRHGASSRISKHNK